jgi:hypothetical protein
VDGEESSELKRILQCFTNSLLQIRKVSKEGAEFEASLNNLARPCLKFFSLQSRKLKPKETEYICHRKNGPLML